MDNFGYVSKIHIIVAKITICLGVLFVIAGLVVFLTIEGTTMGFRFAVMTPALLTLICYGYSLSKCRCPHCKLGGERYSSLWKQFTPKGIKAGHVVCQNCDKQIEIR
ncbi:MAG: hypothetical protein FWE34_03145 [Defluviitaleaceae bacterium]|nr:hypothetical protein [Defluviitaleaceae bacterium]